MTSEYNGQWYRGAVVGSKNPPGIFPVNHIALRAQGDDDSVVSELVEVLKEWGALLRASFQVRSCLSIANTLLSTLSNFLYRFQPRTGASYARIHQTSFHGRRPLDLLASY